MHQLVEAVSRTPIGMTTTEFARRAGVNRSTLHRIESGAVEPTIATLRELALVHGRDLSVTLSPLSDPDAAIAARHILDESVQGLSITQGQREWIARLERSVPEGDDPFWIASTAGRASTLLHREGAVLLRGDASALRLASAGTAAGGRWAVSGRAAIEYGRRRSVQGASVLWADDVARAVAALSDSHRPVSSAANAQVIVVQADPVVYTDTHKEESVSYVAPIQMILDCIGLGGELEAEAESIARGWSE